MDRTIASLVAHCDHVSDSLIEEFCPDYPQLAVQVGDEVTVITLSDGLSRGTESMQ
jgi:hypothetical protein